MPGVFNFDLIEKKRLWESNSILQRLVLTNQFLKKFENVENPLLIFAVDNPDKSSMTLTGGIIILIVGFIILLFLKYNQST